MSLYKVTRSSITSRAEHEIWHTAAHVAWSVCVSVGREDEPIKDSQTDRHRLYQRDIYAVNYQTLTQNQTRLKLSRCC